MNKKPIPNESCRDCRYAVGGQCKLMAIETRNINSAQCLARVIKD